MTLDEQLEKYLKGELKKEEFDAEVAKLSEEEQKKLETPEVRARLKKAADDELKRIEGLRAEGRRIEDRNNQPQGHDYGAILRKENVEKAANKFFTEFKVPAGEQQHYRDAFQTNDSGHVDTDLIFTDFKRIYVAEHSDELLSIKSKYDDLEGGAEEFLEDNSGAPGGGGQGGGDQKKFSPAAHEYVKEAAKKGIKLTLVDAERVLTRGMTRTF